LLRTAKAARCEAARCEVARCEMAHLSQQSASAGCKDIWTCGRTESTVVRLHPHSHLRQRTAKAARCEAARCGVAHLSQQSASAGCKDIWTCGRTESTVVRLHPHSHLRQRTAKAARCEAARCEVARCEVARCEMAHLSQQSAAKIYGRADG